MSSKEFNEALRELGLSVYASPRTLGVSLRQAQRYAAGEHEVAYPVANHLRWLVWSVRDMKERRKETLAAIKFLETKGRMYSNNKDVTADWLKVQRQNLEELEGLLTTAHPMGIKPGLD
jgi:hypothetical protein